MIYQGGLGVTIGKLEVMMSIPKSHDISWLMLLLELCNNYKKFAKAFSAIAKALTMLTRNDQPLVLGEEQKAIFQELKEHLATTMILEQSILRHSIQLHENWSCLEIGGVLIQIEDGGKEFANTYARQSNNDVEA